MDLALNAAWKYQFLTYPNPAVGAVVVGSRGEILSIAAHEKAGGPHAEVLALQKAYAVLSGDDTIFSLTQSNAIHDYLYENHNGLFSDSSIYVTLEPCNHHGKTPPCALLLERIGIAKVCISVEDPSEASGGIKRLEAAGIACETGLLRQRGKDLLAPFIAWQHNTPFLFFKYAQRLNGSVDGGLISNEASRRHLHGLRSVIDRMIITGETVRSDRPRLDSRLVKEGKNPDIIIYSGQKSFDPTIPLFDVAGRSVTITSEKADLRQAGLTMIEGGPGAFEALKDEIDWILIYVSGTMAPGISMQSVFEGEIMHVEAIDDNYLFWIKRKSA